MKISGCFVTWLNILFSYIEKLLPSVMTCQSHFHGLITCVKNNHLCFEFLSIFPYKLSDTFFYKNVLILLKLQANDEDTREKMCIRALKRNVSAGYVHFPERLFNSLEFEQGYTDSSALHLLISYFISCFYPLYLL